MVKGFVYNGRLPSLNEIIQSNRSNKYAGNNIKKTTEEGLILAIRGAEMRGTISKIRKECVILVTYYEPNRRRDVDNVYSSIKFILDALQKAGILKNDSPRYVKDVKQLIAYTTGSGWVEVAIYEDAEFEVVVKEKTC